MHIIYNMKQSLGLKITVLPTWQWVNSYTNPVNNKTSHIFDVAAVLDMLQTTSTITAAINNECSAIILTSKIPHVSIASDIQHGNYSKNFSIPCILLAWKENTSKPKGFHLGNSPLEYACDKVKTKQ